MLIQAYRLLHCSSQVTRDFSQHIDSTPHLCGICTEVRITESLNPHGIPCGIEYLQARRFFLFRHSPHFTTHHPRLR